MEVETDIQSLYPLEEFLARVTPRPRTRVGKDRLPARLAGLIYGKLRAKSVLTVPPSDSFREQQWKLRLDENFDVLPENLGLRLLDQHHPFTVHFEGNGYRETFQLYVECDVEETENAVRFLREIVQKTEAELADPEQSTEEPDAGRWEIDVSGCRWETLAGMDGIIARIRHWVELPLRKPEGFVKLGLRPPKGILMYGPPGTGKSTLARTAANESSAAFFSISPAEINSMWYGGSSRNVRRLFQRLKARAAQGNGAVLFIDEIDGFLRARDKDSHEATRRTLSQLMLEMDAIPRELRIVVIAATNRREDLDSALCRPGRFDYHIEVPLPERTARESILTLHLKDKPCHRRLKIDLLAEQSEGFSGADLEQWCNDATFRAWRRQAEKLEKDLAEMTSRQLSDVRVSNADFSETMPSTNRHSQAHCPESG